MEGVLNCHVKLVGKETTYDIKEIARYSEQGLALLKVTDSDVKPLFLDDSSVFQIVRSTVYAVGDPPESGDMFQKGIIHDIFLDSVEGRINGTSGRKTHTPTQFLDIICFSITIQISQKWSGGPVLNSKGKVIGVSDHRRGIVIKTGNFTFRNESDGNFAISSKTLKALLSELKPVNP